MKTRNLFLSLFAFAALCACNKEEVPVVQDTLDGDSYIAVNIVAPSDAFTKADDGGYATGDENNVKNAYFVFYNNGNFVKAVAPTFTDYSGPDNEDPSANLEKMSEAVVVLSNETTIPNQLLVILNGSEVLRTSLASEPLSEALAICDNYSDYTTNGFLMTNSVYATDANGSTVVNVTTLDPDLHIRPTEAAAKASPVKAYVERVNAKVVVKKGSSYADNNSFEVDGETVTLRHKILGFAITPEANKSYLVKNIAGISNNNDSDASTGYWDGWNDINNFRSYWAVNPSIADNIVYKADFTDADNNYTADWEASGTEYVCYPQENVDQTNNAKLLVAVQIEKQSTVSPGTWEPYTAYSYAGKWYTENYLLNMAHNALTTAGHSYNLSDIAIVDAETSKGYEVKFKFVDESDKAADAIALLSNLGYAKIWENGKCYFYVDINHFGTNNGAALKGLVRNHQYEITINSITGWGTPGDIGVGGGGEDPIVPEDPDDNSYVAATINILKWKVVSQSVDLGN